MVKDRYIFKELSTYLEIFPVVGIVGPRQVGKTTLVKNLYKDTTPSLYLDLEKSADRVKLSDPSFFLSQYPGKRIILDEIQFMPDLFAELRSIVDENRIPGKFILLGSASPDLMRKSADSLAGRVGYLELTPFQLLEIGPDNWRKHWLRGGFPDSFLAKNNAISNVWRENFIKTYLERDLGLLGLQVAPQLMERFWKMLAHLQGGIWNAENLGRSLGITRPTVNRYLDFMEGAFMLRVLRPYGNNVGKRLVKAPKVYIRDSGITHTLLNIDSWEALQMHPSIGASWEAYVIEQIINRWGAKYNYYFYRTHQGAECDLLLEKGGQVVALIEIKLSSAPNIEKGFHISMKDTKAPKSYVIAPVEETYLIGKNITVISLKDFLSIDESILQH